MRRGVVRCGGGGASTAVEACVGSGFRVLASSAGGAGSRHHGATLVMRSYNNSYTVNTSVFPLRLIMKSYSSSVGTLLTMMSNCGNICYYDLFLQLFKPNRHKTWVYSA